jgi:mono/diheme cytochrome c family protein
MKRGLQVTAVLLLVVGSMAAAIWALNVGDEDPIEPASAVVEPAGAAQIARGAYLARAANCAGCHTARGGAAYAGGRGVPTPFGTVYASNLTPDPATGIGRWSAAEFWRALHNGRGRDGRLLYPAFPYPNFTRMERADADAILAYLRSLAPVQQPNRPHALKFPFDRQPALAVWRALYFRPARMAAIPTRSVEWQRGAYLVEALGHCNACHASRNALGATSSPLDLAGGLIPVQNWYAPSLTSPLEAGVADWDLTQIVALLRDGTSARGTAMGPMGEVVRDSTQYLSDSDLRAMAAYLQALPQGAAPGAARVPTAPTAVAGTDVDRTGAKLYERHCADCHGERGAGVAGIYPALAGSRAVTMHSPANLVHIVLEGGFAPATAGNPRPFGMPPFATLLSDDEVARLLTYLRTSWGNRGAAVSALDVAQFRGAR